MKETEGKMKYFRSNRPKLSNLLHMWYLEPDFSDSLEEISMFQFRIVSKFKEQCSHNWFRQKEQTE